MISYIDALKETLDRISNATSTEYICHEFKHVIDEHESLPDSEEHLGKVPTIERLYPDFYPFIIRIGKSFHPQYTEASNAWTCSMNTKIDTLMAYIAQLEEEEE